MSIKEDIIEIIKNNNPESQLQIVEKLASKDIKTTQANVQYYLDKIGAYKENGFYKVPPKKLTFNTKLKELVLQIKNNKTKQEIYIFCIKGSSDLIINAICQNYHSTDLCFKESNSITEAIITIETKFSNSEFDNCLEDINNLLKD